MQIPCDVRGARVEHGTRERIERGTVDVVDDAEIPTRYTDMQHLGSHAQRNVGVGATFPNE